MNATGAREALDGAVTAISAAGCQTPRLDAEVLLAHVLGVPRERLYTDRELTLVGSTIRDFQQAVRRRAIDREPVAYITGVRAFRNIDLAVDRRALIPRPETELLVEAALGLPAGTRVLDLCTGCGAVALALAQERPDLELTGSDLSQDALELARTNAGRLGLDVRWMHADLLEGLDDDFQAIVSNPPYVAEHERAQLEPEIVRHEPPGALFAGADGLDVIRNLLAQAAAREQVRLLAVELGAGQAPAVTRLMSEAGFQDVRGEYDLAGIERVLVGERP